MIGGVRSALSLCTGKYGWNWKTDVIKLNGCEIEMVGGFGVGCVHVMCVCDSLCV